MHRDRLTHDVAMAGTRVILEVFNLRPEEYQEAHGLVYERLVGVLMAYRTHRDRERQRLAKPQPPQPEDRP